ncbi:MAG: ferritin-like domain-containing protein [Oscillospiraceae bacterium]|nr:ferritin-like domain-containing protein [Oscillospiraceae bacterium]
MTTKELMVLEELLGSEQIAVKKYRTMASQCSDPSIRQKLESFSQEHQKHFDTLKSFLK